MRCIWIVWAGLTWASTMLCIFGCILPYWLKGSIEVDATFETQIVKDFKLDLPMLPSSLGIYRRCVYPVYLIQEYDIAKNEAESTVLPDHNEARSLVKLRMNCGHYNFYDIPHTAWKLGLALLVIACAFLCFLTFFLMFAGIYLSVLNSREIVRSCQAILLLSGSMVLICCAAYPIGWSDNPEVMQICGEDSANFHLGRCQIGWAYFLTLLGGLLSIAAAIIPSLCRRTSAQRKPPTTDESAQAQGSQQIALSDLDSRRMMASSSSDVNPSSIPNIHQVSTDPNMARRWIGYSTPVQARLHGQHVVVYPSHLSPTHLYLQRHSTQSPTTASSFGGSSNEIDRKPPLPPKSMSRGSGAK
ncbi:unnamed protein product [Calicophoron daubneyi]|uniref:Lipoma HMGIC fusion partner-like protein n=1 Tax=Calicophoron daubneyi TaxID=300641 RepID=A0AAV2TQU4_CALDB